MEKAPKNLSAEELDEILKEYNENLIKGIEGDTEATERAEELRKDVIEPVAVEASRRLVGDG